MNVNYCSNCIHGKICLYAARKKEKEEELQNLLSKSNFDPGKFTVSIGCPYYKETAMTQLYKQSFTC